MAGPKSKTITSLTEYTSAVQKLLPPVNPAAERVFEGNWYRGVGRAATHKLIPSLYRHDGYNSIEQFLRLERMMLDDFRRQSVLHSDAQMSNATDGDFRTLFMMQHYGIPTRLLDWSTNPFIALYFALTSAAIDPDDKTKYLEDAAIWVLDPVAWNKTALEQAKREDRGPLLMDQADAYKPKPVINDVVAPGEVERMHDRPAAILGIANNARMFAQRGVFTVFGRDTLPMEEQFSLQKFGVSSLTKLIIPMDHISKLLILLVRLGYTDSVSYPDLQGLALEIKRLRGFKV
jgi:hypothetical protein